MANEHEDVSPASAGGAPASKLCFAPVGQNGRGLAIRCDLPWGHPGAHHGVAGIDYGLTVRPAIPEPFRRMFWVAAEDIANVIGCTVVDGEPRGYGEPDPRDAETERLRADLFDYRTRLGNDLLRGGELVERVRAAMRVDDGGTCTRASIGVVGECVRDLCAEIEQLREARSELDRLRASNYADEQLRFDAYAELLNPIREVFGKRPVAASHYRELRDAIARLISNHSVEATRHEQAKADRDEARAELERIAAFVGGSAAMPSSVRSAVEHAFSRRDEKRAAELARLYERLDNQRAEVERADANTVKAVEARDTAEAERDRLRAQWDAVGNGLVLLRQDFTAAVNGLLPKPAEPRRVCGAGNEDYSELSCTLFSGHEGQHEDPAQGATWPAEVATEPKGGA